MMKTPILILIVALAGSGFAVKEFKVFKEKLTWDEAMKSCRDKGLQPASINSDAEYKQLTEILKKTDTSVSYWVGGKKISSTGKDFYWVATNKPLTFKNFADGQPDTPSLGYECMEFWNDKDFKMDDTTCNSKDKYYACESDPCFASKEYKMFNDKLTWDQAMKACQDKGMQMATVNSEAEKNQLYALVKNEGDPKLSYWLGGRKFSNPKNGFYWVPPNKPLGYENFGPNQPDSSNPGQEDCLEMWTDIDYKWNDVDCKAADRPYICEKKVPRITIGLSCESNNFGPFTVSG